MTNTIIGRVGGPGLGVGQPTHAFRPSMKIETKKQFPRGSLGILVHRAPFAAAARRDMISLYLSYEFVTDCCTAVYKYKYYVAAAVYSIYYRSRRLCPTKRDDIITRRKRSMMRLD